MSQIYLIYIKLRLTLGALSQEAQISISLYEVAEMLHFTTKHTKRILKQLESENLITWVRGKGRGNLSHITFTIPLLQFTMNYIKQLQEKDRIEDMIKILQLEFPLDYREELINYALPKLGKVESHENKDTLRTVMKRPLSSLDPAKVAITTESHIISEIYDTLIGFDSEQDVITPRIAHYWESNETCTVWTFYLRKGVQFHHGKLLTSEDIMYTINRLRESSTTKWAVKDLEAIVCEGPYTITLHFRTKVHWLLHFLATTNASILPNDIPFNENRPIGTGGFMVKEFNHKRLLLVAFENYFRERALIDQIEIYVVDNTLHTNRDFTISIRNDDIISGIEKIEVGSMYAMFQLKKGSFMDDPYLRLALYQCIDGENLVHSLGGNRMIPSESFFPERSIQIYKEKSLELARNALRKSSYAGEKLVFYHLDFEGSTKDALWLKERMESIGITVELRSYSLQDFYSENLCMDGHVILMGEVFTENEFLSFIGVFLNETCFIRRYLNEEQLALILPLIETYSITKGHENRRIIQYEIEKVMCENHWMAFTYHVIKKTNLSSTLHGIEMNTFMWPSFRKLWVKNSL